MKKSKFASKFEDSLMEQESENLSSQRSEHSASEEKADQETNETNKNQAD